MSYRTKYDDPDWWDAIEAHPELQKLLMQAYHTAGHVVAAKELSTPLSAATDACGCLRHRGRDLNGVNLSQSAIGALAGTAAHALCYWQHDGGQIDVLMDIMSDGQSPDYLFHPHEEEAVFRNYWTSSELATYPQPWITEVFGGRLDTEEAHLLERQALLLVLRRWSLVEKVAGTFLGSYALMADDIDDVFESVQG